MRIYPCKVVIRSQQVNSRQFRIFEFRSMVLPILLEKTEMSFNKWIPSCHASVQ